MRRMTMKKAVALFWLCSCIAGGWGFRFQGKPVDDPLALTAVEVAQLEDLERKAETAEIDYQRALARRDLAAAEIKRWIAIVVAERGLRPSVWGVNFEAHRVQKIEDKNALEDAQKPVNGAPH
jgi:hypothetical protein